MIVNILGIESSDMSSAYQAQIIAYRLTNNLVYAYGYYVCLFEPFLLVILSMVILFSLTLFVHVVFKIMGGKGTISHAWKAVCYGTAPCILGGFIPYVSLFVGFYSFLLHYMLVLKCFTMSLKARH